jgi:hypothetical protein
VIGSLLVKQSQQKWRSHFSINHGRILSSHSDVDVFWDWVAE